MLLSFYDIVMEYIIYKYNNTMGEMIDRQKVVVVGETGVGKSSILTRYKVNILHLLINIPNI